MLGELPGKTGSNRHVSWWFQERKRDFLLNPNETRWFLSIFVAVASSEKPQSLQDVILDLNFVGERPDRLAIRFGDGDGILTSPLWSDMIAVKCLGSENHPRHGQTYGWCMMMSCLKIILSHKFCQNWWQKWGGLCHTLVGRSKWSRTWVFWALGPSI